MPSPPSIFRVSKAPHKNPSICRKNMKAHTTNRRRSSTENHDDYFFTYNYVYIYIKLVPASAPGNSYPYNLD